MTQSSTRLLGNIILAIAIVILAVNLAGMVGWITKLAPSRELNLVSIVLVIAGGAMRRRSREPRA